MAQDFLITMKCTKCSNRNYYTYKNKKKIQEKLELKKHCPKCKAHTIHKETKLKK
ncbi:MAG: 50S ribosomal protein L33 [Patescibacteria group bacterium]|nr:50S ribosomal protein L33 [Patescibacteria group bacterium]